MRTKYNALIKLNEPMVGNKISYEVTEYYNPGGHKLIKSRTRKAFNDVRYVKSELN